MADSPARVVTVFRNRLRPEAADEYGVMLTRMRELATAMPGYVEAKTFTADDGERVTIVVFEDPQSEAAWRDHPEHRQAQRAGADRFYSAYSVQVATVTYEHSFTRED